MISDDEVCSICADNSRDRNLICVVESVRDVMSIENTGQYHGVYHVLGGIISPINGVGPSDLTIRELVNRVQAVAPLKDASAGSDSLVESGSVAPVASVVSTAPVASVVSTAPAVEILLALSGDVEGETTAFYIYRQLAPYNVKVTSLARGLGFGDDLEYADELTLGRSIINRQVFKP
jgi:recombination protein RecR